MDDFEKDKREWIASFEDNAALQAHLDAMARVWHGGYEQETGGETANQAITDFLYREGDKRLNNHDVALRAFGHSRLVLTSARLDAHEMKLCAELAGNLLRFFSSPRAADLCAQFLGNHVDFADRGPWDYTFWLEGVAKINSCDSMHELVCSMYEYPGSYLDKHEFRLLARRKRVWIDPDALVDGALAQKRTQIEASALEDAQKLLCMKGVLVLALSLCLTRYYSV